MDSFRGLLGVRRLDRIPNVQMREICVVTKQGDERIDENVLRWFGYNEKIGIIKLLKGLIMEDFEVKDDQRVKDVRIEDLESQG